MNRYGNLKTVKEIAAEIGRSRFFIHAAKSAMEEAGIFWVMNMIPIEDFVKWVDANKFRSTGYRARTKTEKARGKSGEAGCACQALPRKFGRKRGKRKSHTVNAKE